jgi:hypothetical protein
VPVVVAPLRKVPIPVSAARGIAPSSSVLGEIEVIVICSLSRLPRIRIFGALFAPVPKSAISCAVAGVSLEPDVPPGSSSSMAMGAAVATSSAGDLLAASALRRAAAFAPAWPFRYFAQPA